MEVVTFFIVIATQRQCPEEKASCTMNYVAEHLCQVKKPAEQQGIKEMNTHQIEAGSTSGSNVRKGLQNQD